MALLQVSSQEILAQNLNCTLPLSCLNDCSGHGECVANDVCLSAERTRGQLIEEKCLSHTKCNCDEGWGGKDCSLDKENIAGLGLQAKCCDLRNEKCNQVNAIGYPFSTTDKIYVKVEYIERLDDLSENVIQEFTTARALSESNILIDLEGLGDLTLYKNINNLPSNLTLRESETKVKIWISYYPDEYKQVSSFLLYDSKCRSCKDGESSFLEDRCEIDGVCYLNDESSNKIDYLFCNTENPNEWTDNRCDGKAHSWTQWFDLDTPEGDGDLELFTLLDSQQTCRLESKLTEVRAESGLSVEEAGQHVHANESYGFMCLNKENEGGCVNYQIRQCCPNGYFTTVNTETSVGETQQVDRSTGEWSEVSDQSTDTESSVTKSEQSSEYSELNDATSVSNERTDQWNDATNQWTDSINTNEVVFTTGY